MYVKKMSILFMVLMVCLFNLSYAQEVKQVTFKGTVVDDQEKPVAGAKAKLYKEDYGREMYLVTVSAVLETTTNAKIFRPKTDKNERHRDCQ